jgi:cell division protein FtsB
VADARAGRKLRMHRSVFLALLGLVLIAGAVKFCVPWAAARRQQEELNELRREKAQLETEAKQLTRYKRQLASDQGLESAARREGYVRQGDRRIIFVPEKKRGDQDSGKTVERESVERSGQGKSEKEKGKTGTAGTGP